MRIALAQIKNEGSIAKNLDKCMKCIKIASENKADLILFPEVHLTEFFPQYEALDVSKYRLAIDSAEVKAFQSASREYHIMTVPNIYLEEKGRNYDASLLIDKNGDVLGVQKMVHVAQAKQFYEQDYYTPSDDGFKVWETSFGRIGIVVCFDRHYPESIRTEALKGADLILIPTVNTKSEPSEMFEWELRVQAFQNSVAVVMCNRVGCEGEMDFSGESIAVDAQGNVMVKADDTEQLLYVDMDIRESARIRKDRPYTQLRRPDFYNVQKTYNFWGWENSDTPAITDEYPGINTPTDLYDALSHIWCQYTCAPRMRDRWTKENMTLGQCSITAFLAQDIFGGEVYGIKRPGGNYHCYNVIGSCRFDLTSEQFGQEILDYEDNPVQLRETHFSKEEKRLRYEYLREELKKYTKNDTE